MPPKRRSEAIQNEGKIILAIQAIQSHQVRSIRAAAKLYDVKVQTLRDRLNGRQPRVESSPNGSLLSPTDELVLKDHILDADQRGLPPRHQHVREMASILAGKPVGENWVSRFIKRHEELRSRYTRRYDYQRACCEDPAVLKAWFLLVKNTIRKYGITDEDIYNFDETGFCMGLTSTCKVISGQDSARARHVQPGNREWVTVIEATGATGYLLPPLIIFKGKEHPDTWYKELPKDWSIAVSPNGWTTDEIGRYWVEKVFNLHTKDRCVGAYRLLVLDGHNSHSTAQFEHFCGENKIIPLYLPPHSSHLLQPLDVGCFGPLKKAYGSQVQGYIRAGVNHVDKADFLKLYQTVRPHAFRAENIISSFAAAGLVPYNPDQVMDFEHLNVGTPPPPSSSAGSTSSAVATPTTTRQLVKRSALLQRIWERRSRSPPSPLKNAISGIIKGCHMAMGNAALLEREVGDLRAANRRQVQKRETTKKVLQKDGILTRKEVEKQIEEAIQADQADQATAEASDRPRKKAPPTCSDCHTQGHIRTQCKSR